MFYFVVVYVCHGSFTSFTGLLRKSPEVSNRPESTLGNTREGRIDPCEILVTWLSRTSTNCYFPCVNTGKFYIQCLDQIINHLISPEMWIINKYIQILY